MSEGSEDWGDLDALPPQKSVVPRWLWFCGGGCLVMLGLVLFAGWWTFDWVQDGMDTEAQWERIAQVLPYDERTADYELSFGQRVPFLDCEVFVFVPKGLRFTGPGRTARIERDTDAETDAPEARAEEGADSEVDGASDAEDAGAERERTEGPVFVALLHFELEEEQGGALDSLGGDDAERFDLEVQGIELAAYRVKGSGPTVPGMPAGSGASVMVVLPSDDPATQSILMFVRDGKGEPPGAPEITEFLAPFHVGPDR